MINEDRFLEEVTLLYKRWESEAKDFNNILLSHCEDLDEVMGVPFGAGWWHIKRDLNE